MTSGDSIDALAVARQQLHGLLDSAHLSPSTPQFRLELGLLAAVVALAERLPDRVSVAPPTSIGQQPQTQAPGAFWSPERINTVVDNLTPGARRFLQALVDKGGSATPQQLKDATGAKSLGGTTAALRGAVNHVTRGMVPAPKLVQARRIGNMQSPIQTYYLAPGVLEPLRHYLAAASTPPQL